MTDTSDEAKDVASETGGHLSALLRGLGAGRVPVTGVIAELKKLRVSQAELRKAALASKDEFADFLNSEGLISSNKIAAEFFDTTDRTIARWKTGSTIPAEPSRRILGVTTSDWRLLLQACVDSPSAPGGAAGMAIGPVGSVDKLTLEPLLTRDPGELDHILTFFGSYEELVGRFVVLQNDRIRAADFGAVNEGRTFLGNFVILVNTRLKEFLNQVETSANAWVEVGYMGAIDIVMLVFDALVITVTPLKARSFLLSVTVRSRPNAAVFGYFNMRATMGRLVMALHEPSFKMFDADKIDKYRRVDYLKPMMSSVRRIDLDRLSLVIPTELTKLFSSKDYSNNAVATGVAHFFYTEEGELVAADRALIDETLPAFVGAWEFLGEAPITKTCRDISDIKASLEQNDQFRAVAGRLQQVVVNCERGVLSAFPFKGADEVDCQLLSISPWNNAKKSQSYNFTLDEDTVVRLLNDAADLPRRRAS